MRVGAEAGKWRAGRWNRHGCKVVHGAGLLA
jgi:hypothetical protein